MRIAAILALALVSCGSRVGASTTPSVTATSAVATSAPPASASLAMPARQLPAAEAQRLVSGRVAATLDALKRRDGPALATVAHATKGVRFTAYPFVRTAMDIVLTRADVAKAYTDPTKRTWGVSDGKGDPLTMTFSDYDKRYVFSRDFQAAPKTSYNKAIGSGNSIDNTAEAYPNAILFEAYDPGPVPAEESLRWQSLRLLYERDGTDWYLVGVVHAEWTI